MNQKTQNLIQTVSAAIQAIAVVGGVLFAIIELRERDSEQEKSMQKETITIFRSLEPAFYREY